MRVLRVCLILPFTHTFVRYLYVLRYVCTVHYAHLITFTRTFRVRLRCLRFAADYDSTRCYVCVYTFTFYRFTRSLLPRCSTLVDSPRCTFHFTFCFTHAFALPYCVSDYVGYVCLRFLRFYVTTHALLHVYRLRLRLVSYVPVTFRVYGLIRFAAFVGALITLIDVTLPRSTAYALRLRF